MSQTTQELATTLAHLTALVAFDTQNPPRAISTESEIFNYLKQHLPGFGFEMLDAGDGCVALLAKRGNPELLLNFHIDTVPAADAWSSDPLTLIIAADKVTGLGACDIKGAAACMLTAVTKTKGDIALLFSSDEEHGSSVAVKYFLHTNHGFKKVLIAEPTGAKAVLAHRGIQTASINFSGISGHGSELRALTDSAIHKSGKWIAAAIDWVEQQSQTFDTLQGLPFNIGKIAGGIKANMIASSCAMTFGFRPLPGQDAKAMLVELQQLACLVNNLAADEVLLSEGFYGPTLPAANQNFDSAINNAKQLAEQCNLPIGSAVNFWTEASLFSAAGMTALVYGPGNISQAHTADEWVTLDQLQQVENRYCQILKLYSGQPHEF